MSQLFRHYLATDRRRLPVQIGIVVTFLLIPFWLRLPEPPVTYSPIYGMGFYLSLPIIFTIIAWLLMGMPGLGDLLRDGLRLTWALALIGLAGWMWLSVQWSFIAGQEPPRPNVTQSAALQFSMVVLWVIAAACAAPPARIIAGILVFNGLWNSAIAIVQATKQGAIGLFFLGEFHIAPDAPNANVLISDGVRWLRPSGLLPHPNTLAAILMIGLLATTILILSPSRRIRWFGIFAVAFILWGFLLTFSRAAFIGFAAAGFALLPLIWRELRQKAVRGIIAITLVVVLVTGAIFGVTYRSLILTRAGVGEESVELRSVADRLIFSLLAYRAITENRQNLIFGIGAGNFPWRSAYYLAETDYDLRGNNVHHVFLSAGVETGLVGYTFFVVALFAGFEAALQMRKRELRNPTPALPVHGEGAKRADSFPTNKGIEYAESPPLPKRQRLRGSGVGGWDLANDTTARSICLVGVVGLAVIGLFDHYPWTMLHFQTLWWGLLAMSARPITQT